MSKTYLLDTNALVRYITYDDPVQGDEVRKFLNQVKSSDGRIYIPLFVFIETIFVLLHNSKYPREMIAEKMQKISEVGFIEVENRHLVIDSLLLFIQKKSLSIVDILLLNIARQENFSLFTFDKKMQLVLKNL